MPMLAVTAVLGLLGTPVQGEVPRWPNVIYVLADDLGWGELGCYGQARIQTPNIDRIASEGMRFTQHYSGSPVCAPARCVLLTGLHTGHAIVRDNWENGGWGPEAPEGQYPLPAGTRTLPGILKAAGYHTAAIGKWGLGGPGTSGHPNRQGFDRFLGYLCQRQAHNYYPTHLWSDARKLPLEGNPWFQAHQRIDEPLRGEDAYWTRYSGAQYAPDLMIAAALTFVREHASEPFFLLYASPLPHVAIQVPPGDLEAYPPEWDDGPYLGQKGYLPHPSPRRGYAAMVSRLDSEVGALLALLDELELTDDTIVFFSSDNGPTFNGGSDSAFFESTGGLRGGKTQLYEGGIRVPLVVRWPGRIAPGAESAHVSAFQDLLPTVLELAGLDPEDAHDGLSFAATLLGSNDQETHEHLYWEYSGSQAVRAGKWKAVRARDGTLELFDLDADPREATDLADEHPAEMERIERLLRHSRTESTAFPLVRHEAR